MSLSPGKREDTRHYMRVTVEKAHPPAYPEDGGQNDQQPTDGHQHRLLDGGHQLAKFHGLYRVGISGVLQYHAFDLFLQSGLMFCQESENGHPSHRMPPKHRIIS